MATVELSSCVWALTSPEEDALDTLSQIGFRSVDIQAKTFQSPQARTRIQDLGFSVRCLGLSFNMDDSAALDGTPPAARQAALAHCRESLDHAAALSIGTLPHFTTTLIQVAEFATERGIRVGVEHFPGKALPTASGTLDYLADLGHPNLYLLLDSGHLQISKEDPATVIDAAGDRLGYVHLDDNDGEDDLHWSLLDGVLTENELEAIFAALERSPYTGPVSLELNPNLPDPTTALSKSRTITLQHL